MHRVDQAQPFPDAAPANQILDLRGNIDEFDPLARIEG